jgi:hypothetical protein
MPLNVTSYMGVAEKPFRVRAMRNSSTLRKFAALLATGALTAAVSGPFPFSANAVITGKTQDKDKDKAAKNDKAKSKDKSKDKDKGSSQSGGNTSNSGGKNDGGKGSFDPPNKSGGGSTQHDNTPNPKPSPSPK